MLSALKVAPGQEDDVFESFVYTNIPISAQITKLTGISQETLATRGKELESVINEFTDFVDGCKLVAHNIKFDLAFLDAARKKMDMEAFTNESVDTLALAKSKLRSLKNHKLATIAEHLGISVTDAHNASSDCLVTRKVYECLIAESE
jgi:DNA polymerase III epsilon subunit family exonuclease